MKNSLIKKIILVTVCIISCLGLTGCGTSLTEFAGSTLPVALKERGETNKRIAKQFMDINALSESQYEAICKDIDKQIAKYVSETDSGEIDNNVAMKKLSNIAPAVTRMSLTSPSNKFPSSVQFTEDEDTKTYYLVNMESGINYHEAGQTAGYYLVDPSVYVETNEAYKHKGNKDANMVASYVMSNYLTFDVQGGKNYEDGNDTVNIPDNEVRPIELVSKNVKDDINKALKAKLYVLRQDILTTNDINTLDSLIANVNKTIDSNIKDSKKAAEFNAYFTSAVDKNGDPIYLIDPDDKDYDIIRDSRPNPGTENRPGYDLMIDQDDLTRALDVRFTEFDSVAYELLEKYISAENIYLLHDSDGEWRAYLMVYPIDVVDSLKLCNRSEDWAKDDGGFENVEVTFKKSGLGINIKTGQFVKYKYDENKADFDYTDSELINTDTNNLYLTLTPSQNNDATGLSSLVLNGVSDYTIEDSSGKEYKFKTGRVILRDYLEATYAPDYNTEYGDNGTGNMAVFGRKIRLDMSNDFFHEDPNETYTMSSASNKSVNQTVLVYERGISIASFVDKNGEEIPESPKLEITDFCDYEALMGNGPNNCQVQRLPYKNEENFTNNREVTSNTPDITELSVSNEQSVVRPVTWFPSPNIGVVDYNSDTIQKQRFYCIATTKGMFGSALYSSWVESTVPDANLDWWNEYLQSNGFSYNVEHVDIARYLSDNYKYQLSQNGVVIIDLETVEKIQEMYDEEADSKRVGAIRTAFVFIGWVLIVGSFVLMLLWVFDTNTDLGFGLLEKVTLGNWVAVKYAEDIPTHNVNDQKYVCFKDICIRTMILIAIGILLIRIDIFYILTVLIDVFGNIASQLEKLIKGRIG